MSNTLIKNLAKDIVPWKPVDSLPLFFTKWLILSALFFGLNALWMPWRLDFHAVVIDSAYLLENVLWLAVTCTGAFALYESSFPQNDTKIYKRLSIVLITLLMVLAFKNHSASFSEQWHPEMSWWRGRCGIIISLFAVLETPFLVAWAKRGAPRSAGLSGIYAALTSASLGCLLMQIICDHHNSLHLILWHFIPLALTCLGGYFTAKKFLHW